MYEIDNKKFGAFLVQLRKEKGLTQRELAERLYVSDKAVSKWERALSLPDIALLQPMAELLEVSVTELLSGQYIREDQPMTVQEVEPLLTGALTLTAQEQADQRVRRKRWGLRMCFAVLVFALEMVLAIRRGVSIFADQFAMLWLPPLMAAGFGLSFVFMREKLPAFYDQYKLNFVSDGFFRMNVPGVHFNNRNWPHIINTMRTWSCITTAGWGPVFALLWWALKALAAPWIVVHFVTLFSGLAAILGGLLIPVVVVGRKYE